LKQIFASLNKIIISIADGIGWSINSVIIGIDQRVFIS
jgi:hypothetical protein